MKAIFLAAALLLACSAGLRAQHETIFGKGRVVGGFGGPIVEMGLRKGFGTSFGGGGGIVFDHFFLGGYGSGTADLRAVLKNNNIDRLELAHGGFWLGVTTPTHKAAHLYGSARMGWGALNILLDRSRNTEVDQIFVFTPEVGAELNLLHWFRIAGSAGYRLVNGANARAPYKDADFSGPTATLTFRFGWFGNGR